MKIDGFLKTIVDLKQKEVSHAVSHVPLNRVRQEAESVREAGQFKQAIEKRSPGDVGIIAEIKRASPSRGDICPALDCAAYVKKYTKAGACAISVLTESRFFKGSLADLEKAAESTHLPVLRKDFTISAYQIYEARAKGAAAVLLITAILEKSRLADYIALSRQLNMTPLVEIHTEYELEKAHACGADVIGINNRNLATLETDLDVSARIAPLLDSSLTPVEASGITSAADVQKGIDCGIYNFLVGEHIVIAPDAEKFIRALRKTGRSD